MHLFLCDAPCLSVVRITLIEEVGASVLVCEQMGMTALGNTDVPTLPVAARMRRNAVVHQVAPLMEDYNRVFGKERTGAAVVAINELGSVAKVAGKQTGRKQQEA